LQDGEGMEMALLQLPDYQVKKKKEKEKEKKINKQTKLYRIKRNK